ncbi:general secretion pathway protein B [Halospina denitrificans]|uniref:General secretion pathway protein B n=1 Tax=Halospina denitrificans TaxID=332522 RepID=A0A4R7K0U4_9GAMM|nr:general secretion pathway protein GspB [Halospina denitrificans]TDT44460.1 general secretion pathway protein B [Halospina denitrificans]
MSYILDALKKSEAERSSLDRPEFAHRVPFESTPRKQREIWPYLLVLVLMANAFVIGYVMWPESAADEAANDSGQPAAVVQRQQSVERETASTAAEPSVRDEAESPEKAEASGTPETPAPVIAEDSPSKQAPATSAEPSRSDSSDTPPREDVVQEEQDEKEEVPNINAMPRSVQRRVPEMTFNAHLYSSKPSSRRVMINNQYLGEGDRLGGLVIREITAAGVVFRLDEHVFQIDVVRDWQGAL